MGSRKCVGKRQSDLTAGVIFSKCVTSEIDIGEGEKREHPRAFFFDASIADLPISELAFQDAEHVFDHGADSLRSSLRLGHATRFGILG